MKKFLILTALAATLVPVGESFAAKKNKAGGEGLVRGRITEVKADAANPKAFSVLVQAGNKNKPKDVTLTADENTKVTIDGEAAKLADLHPGQPITASADGSTVQKIAALTRAQPKGGGAAAEAAPADEAKPASAATPATKPSTQPAKS